MPAPLCVVAVLAVKNLYLSWHQNHPKETNWLNKVGWLTAIGSAEDKS
jgi:hypothetical protein